MKKFFYAFVLSFLFIGFVIGESKQITILNINDTHSCLSPGGERDANLKPSLGGIARAATYIGMTKSDNPNTLVLHAGDYSIGDLFYNKYFGAVELSLLMQMGVDAMTLGNHEFDLTPAVLQLTLAGAFPSKAIPIVSANIDISDASLATLRKYVTPYIIKDVDGVKIGIFGMITPETSLLSNPSPVVIGTAEQIPGTIMATVNELQTKGAQIIIMLSHLGISNDIAIAKALPGIDIVVSGHDHSVQGKPYEIKNPTGGTTYIMEAYAQYKFIGQLDLDYDNGIKNVNWKNVPLDANIPEEPTTAGVINGIITEIETSWGKPIYTQKIADVTETLYQIPKDLMHKGYQDVPTGNLIADAYLAWGKTDVAIIAGGSMAQPLYKGPIVADDIYRMISYGFNTDNYLGFRMDKFKVTGLTLYKGLMFGLTRLTTLADQFLAQCAGMKYEVSFDPQGGVTNLNVTIGDKPLDMQATYTLTTNEFVPLVFKSLGFEVLEEQIEKGLSEFEVVTAYVTALKTITPKIEGRINFLSDVISETDVTEPVESFRISTYPNPCTEKAFIKFNVDSPDIYSLKIYDLMGIEIGEAFSEYMTTGEQLRTINTKDLPTGLYIYKLVNGKCHQSGKLIINN
jgi:2',3'-cyclic-nucleotide 2'-phosphodiesterase (5'-nucleotidase family)